MTEHPPPPDLSQSPAAGLQQLISGTEGSNKEATNHPRREQGPRQAPTFTKQTTPSYSQRERHQSPPKNTDTAGLGQPVATSTPHRHAGIPGRTPSLGQRKDESQMQPSAKQSPPLQTHQGVPFREFQRTNPESYKPPMINPVDADVTIQGPPPIPLTRKERRDRDRRRQEINPHSPHRTPPPQESFTTATDVSQKLSVHVGPSVSKQEIPQQHQSLTVGDIRFKNPDPKLVEIVQQLYSYDPQELNTVAMGTLAYGIKRKQEKKEGKRRETSPQPSLISHAQTGYSWNPNENKYRRYGTIDPQYRVQEEQEESYASDYTDEHVDMPGEHYEARKRKEEQREEQPRLPRQYYRRNDQGPPSGGGSDDSYPQGPGGPRRNVPRAPRIPKINNPPGLPRQLYNQQPPQNLPAPIGLKIKTKEPDVFDGASSKLDDWFRQIDSYFVLQSAIFIDDDAKVLSALQYIRGGTAGQWAAHHAQAFLNARNGEPYYAGDIFWTWDDLKAAMRKRFGDQYKKETARRKIMASRQGQKTIAVYIEEFLKQIPDADLPEDQLCQYFQGGVNDALWGMVETLDLPRNDLQALIQIFERSEVNWVARNLSEQQRKEQLRKATYTNNNSFNKNPGQVHPRRDGYAGGYRKFTPKKTYSTPHKTNAITSNPNPPSKTQTNPKAGPSGTSANVDGLRNQATPRIIRCYKCGGPGHMARECTAKGINEMSQDYINEVLSDRFNNATIHEEEEPEEQEDPPFSIDNPYAACVEDAEDEDEHGDFH
jgi:hypothetical protein